MASDPNRPTFPGADALQNASETMRSAGARAAETTQTLNAKVIDHAETNVREAFGALRAAATASSIADVLKVQGDYVREQSQRSMEQAREIGELIAGFGRNAMEAMRPRGQD